ncbi:hypothetical protein Btru_051242 [Bulinus truncatus]|nr:hypothetical protein Btru_051242 [Bulinus truncatus]
MFQSDISGSASVCELLIALVMITCGLFNQVHSASCPEFYVQNGQVNYTDPYRENGSRYGVFCLPGYVIQVGLNTQSSACLNGTWAVAPPAMCDVIDCGQPPSSLGMTMTYDNSTLSLTDYSQEVTYICPSGNTPVARNDKSEIVRLRCNATAQWEVTLGLTNNTAKLLNCSSIYNYHGCYKINDTMTPVMTETATTIAGNRDQCMNFCKREGFIFTARQGNTCYCLKTLQYVKANNTDCNKYCFDALSFCGGEAELYSVWDTIYPCVKVDSGYTAPTQMTMYTGETCQQFCRGADQSLAFWRQDVRLCNCFDAIPIFTGSSYCYYTQDTIDPDIGFLYITEVYSNVKFNNCVEIFNEGIFYSGQYIVMNGSKVVCYFFDNSTTSCSANWVAYKGNCYLFLDTLRDMSDHHHNSCIPQGSQLVSVGDANEGYFITNAMSKMAHVKLLPVFIGLYDIQQTFSYMWVDETAFTFRNFADDYPKIIINRCVVYDRGTMKNSDCSSLNGAICEISQSTVGCVSTNATQLQLKTVSLKMSTPFCFESCRSSRYRYSATRNISCFCGNDSSQFTLVDWQQCDTRCPRHKYQLCGGNETGTVFVTADIGQPYRESCLSMILGSLLSNVTVKTSNGTLQNVDCLEYAGVICPESWVEIDGRCYRFFIESIEDPSLMCSNIGSYLVVYETDEEAKSVLETIQSAPLLSSQARWTFGLFHHRPQTSYLRYASGAYVNESLKSLLDEDSFSCYAHTSFDAKNITGVLCNRYSYICERGPDFLGCYMSLSPQYQRLSGYRDLTVTQCLETCKGLGKRLAGIKFQTACYCIENENITKATNDYLCEKTCCFQQSCGSAVNDYMTVYEIDYSKNASSCKELFNQGVLLSGLYSLSKGVTTWCGMKDSQYLAQQVEIWSMNGTSEVNFTDLTWHRVGAANVTLAVDVIGGSKSSLLYQCCDGNADKFSS